MPLRPDPMAVVHRPATIAPRDCPADDLIPGDILVRAHDYILCHPTDGRLHRLEANAMRARPGPDSQRPLFTALPKLWIRWRLTNGWWQG